MNLTIFPLLFVSLRSIIELLTQPFPSPSSRLGQLPVQENFDHGCCYCPAIRLSRAPCPHNPPGITLKTTIFQTSLPPKSGHLNKGKVTDREMIWESRYCMVLESGL